MCVIVTCLCYFMVLWLASIIHILAEMLAVYGYEKKIPVIEIGFVWCVKKYFSFILKAFVIFVLSKRSSLDLCV